MVWISCFADSGPATKQGKSFHGSYPNLWSVEWTGKNFIAVGDMGAILLSDDGTYWEKTSDSTTFMLNLKSVVWAKNEYVACGDDLSVIVSSDGRTWGIVWRGVQRKASFNTLVRSKKGFIAAGTDACTSSKDGPKDLDWNVGTIYCASPYDDGYVVVGEKGLVGVSHDVINLRKLDPFTQVDLFGIGIVGDSVFVVGDRGAIFERKEGQEKWLRHETPTDECLNDILIAGDKRIAVGDARTILLGTADGRWKRITVESAGWLSSVAWSGERFVAVGQSGAILTSEDGETWRSRSVTTWTEIRIVPRKVKGK